MSCRAVVVGIGNEFRNDDGVGLEVVHRLEPRMPSGARAVLSDGEPTQLIEAWGGVALAVVVDAVTGGTAPAGTLHRLTLAGDEQAWMSSATAFGASGEAGRRREGHIASWHGTGLGTAVELGLALGRLPAMLVVHGVQASDVSQGRGLSPEVAGAVDGLVDLILAELPAALDPSAQPQSGTLRQRR